MNKKLVELQKLTCMSREVELAKLRVFLDQDAELKQSIAVLGQNGPSGVLVDGDGDRMIIAQEIHSPVVNAWKEKRIAELNGQRANVKAKLENQRILASRAFGRDEAMLALIKRLKSSR